MRLYLSSFDLSAAPEELLALTGAARRRHRQRARPPAASACSLA
jgi:hypothetical protein